MNHRENAKDLLCAYFGMAADGDKGDAQEAATIVDHIIAAAVEAVEAKHRSPGCDEAPTIDPDMPRRFRWLRTNQIPEDWRYGCYFPQYNVNYSGIVERPGKPDWPVEWIDHEPESP